MEWYPGKMVSKVLGIGEVEGRRAERKEIPVERAVGTIVVDGVRKLEYYVEYERGPWVTLDRDIYVEGEKVEEVKFSSIRIDGAPVERIEGNGHWTAVYFSRPVTVEFTDVRVTVMVDTVTGKIKEVFTPEAEDVIAPRK